MLFANAKGPRLWGNSLSFGSFWGEGRAALRRGFYRRIRRLQGCRDHDQVQRLHERRDRRQACGL